MVRLADLILKSTEIKRIAATHGAHHIAVFGSVARNQNTDSSDIDLLIDLDEDRSLLDRIALKQELEDLLGQSVDVINRRSLHPALQKTILHDGVDL